MTWEYVKKRTFEDNRGFEILKNKEREGKNFYVADDFYTEVRCYVSPEEPFEISGFRARFNNIEMAKFYAQAWLDYKI